MNAREYLGQAYWLDKQIDIKLEEIDRMHMLATKCSQSFSLVPPSGSHDNHRLESILVKICDYQHEVDGDIDRMIAMKKEIEAVIELVPQQSFRSLLKMRYVHFMTWEMIAVQMNLSIRSVYRVHGKALVEVAKIIDKK